MDENNETLVEGPIGQENEAPIETQAEVVAEEEKGIDSPESYVPTEAEQAPEAQPEAPVEEVADTEDVQEPTV